MRLGIFFLIILSFFPSCKNKTRNFEQSQVKSEDIVIIFKNAPEKKKIETPIGVGYTVFFERIASYFDQYEEKVLNPKRGSTVDTIKITPKEDVIELIVEDGKYDFLHYLLKKGDTLTLDYNGTLPTAYLNNVNAYYVNYDNFIYNQFKKEYAEKIKFLYPMPFISFNEGENIEQYRARFQNFKREIGEQMINDLAIESKILDSLYDIDQISKEKYQYRKNNITFYDILYKLEYNTLKVKTIDSLIQKSDSLIFMHLYRNLLTKLINKRYVLNSTSGKNNGFFVDSRVIFDSILKSDDIPKFTKRYLLYNNLKDIIKNYSSEDFGIYFDKFEEEVKDSSLINYIGEKYLLDFATSKKETKNVLLSTLEKEKFRLDDILRNNKGKLVYVDFWASWCAPCRVAMPNSRALRQKYSEKGIVFLYISIDKDFQEWISASKEEGLLLDNKNNLIALNYPEAELYRNITLSSIPRYLIYDKKGELIYKNAPAPNSKQIEGLFQKLIEKE